MATAAAIPALPSGSKITAGRSALTHNPVFIPIPAADPMAPADDRIGAFWKKMKFFSHFSNKTPTPSVSGSVDSLISSWLNRIDSFDSPK